jgi:hypothetical protein
MKGIKKSSSSIVRYAKIKVLGILFSGLFMLTLSACQNPPSDDGEVLFVDSQLVDCLGVVPQKCLKTKANEADNWTFFYDQIKGFEFEEGYRYKLQVEITQQKNSPQDGSSLHYKLIKVLERNLDK